VKRLALEDEVTHHMKLSPVRLDQNLEPVLSISRDDFDQIYQKLDEIGRGGFSTVYKCVNKITKEIYAVKVREFSLASFLTLAPGN
jgi:serine/threonine protein kinase